MIIIATQRTRFIQIFLSENNITTAESKVIFYPKNIFTADLAWKLTEKLLCWLNLVWAWKRLETNRFQIWKEPHESSKFKQKLIDSFKSFRRILTVLSAKKIVYFRIQIIFQFTSTSLLASQPITLISWEKKRCHAVERRARC